MSVDVAKGNLLLESGPSPGVWVVKGNLLMESSGERMMVTKANLLTIYAGSSGRRRTSLM